MSRASQVKTIFERLFQLFPGEERAAFLFALLAFFWAAAAAAALKFADALFLLHIGPESLPLLYSLSAAAMILMAALLVYAFHTFAPYKVFMAALSLSSLFYLSVFFLFFQETGSPWIWYLFRLFGSVNFAVIGTSFWTFIDQYYHLQDAKRLFSLFNATIFLGISLTGLIMYLSLFEFQTLALFIALFLGVAIGLIYIIHRQVVPLHDDTHIEEEPLNVKKWVKDIARSKFTLLLVTSNLLLYLLMATTEFNYYSTFEAYFDTDAVAIGDEGNAKLTQFLGEALAGVSFTNLLFGLFFYSRLLRRFGIGFLLPVTPLLLIFTYSLWQNNHALWIALIGYFVVEGTNYVVDDSNFTLLLNAVPPRFKPKIRLAIESFFEPIGTLIAATLLSAPFINPKLLGLILSLTLLALAISLRRQYLKAIWDNLAQNALHFRRTIGDWFRQMTKMGRRTAFKSLRGYLRDPHQAAFAITSLAHSEDKMALHQLLKEMETFSVDEKVHCIAALEDSSFAKDPLVIETAQTMLMQAENPRLIQELYWFLAKRGLLHPDKLNDELTSPNPKLKGAAILTLLTAQADFSPEVVWAHKTLAVEELGELFEADDEPSIQTGLKILSLDPSLQNMEIALSFLTHVSSAIRREAALCIYHMASPQMAKYAPRIASLLLEVNETEAREYLLKALGRLGDPQQLESCLKACIHFRPREKAVVEEVIASMGLKNVPLLFTFLKNRAIHDRSRLVAGKALGKIALFQLRARLPALLQPEIERALFFWQHWHCIKDQPDLNLLSDTLKADYYSVLDFIIQLLGTAGEVADTELLSRALRSPFVKIRSQGIETLEKTCEHKIFRQLQPLLEDNLVPHQNFNLENLLQNLRHSSSIADKIVAYTYMKKYNLAGWKRALKEEMIHSEEVFKHFAYELLI